MAKILVLEDEYVQADAMRRALEAAGHEVVGLAPTAERALEIAQKRRPDLLVCDISIAGDLDGVGAATEMHRLHRCKVLIITGYPDSLTSSFAVENCGVVRKPWSDEDLLQAVDECLGEDGPTRAYA